jgi:hypothetical protein
MHLTSVGIVYADPYDSPDYITVTNADEPGYELLIVKWKDKPYILKVKGRVADKKNEKKVTQWILDRAEEQ